MKILMITEKDAANVSLARISDSFLNNGHEIVIYAPYFAENVLKFFDKRIPRFPLSDLRDDRAADCDIIFASSLVNYWLADKNLLSIKKPIFTQNYLINKQRQWGGDVCFVPSLASTVTDYDKYLKYTKIEIGEPKYDHISLSSADSKRFLFIDSGHYPFGKKGKKELARTLLDICKSFPDYELWIKPRFLPGDEVITHKNHLHLYDVIEMEAEGNIPCNLVMLKEHRDLTELIGQSTTVLCMYTTAFVGAYASGKGLVVLDNLPSEDVYDVRWKSFNRIRDHMVESKAVIDYRQVKGVLPQGVKCSETYFRYLLAEKENTADKICEVTEYIYEKFYKKQKFPKVNAYAYQDYKTSIHEAADLDWDKVIRDRFAGCLLQRMLSMIDFNINAVLDVSSLVGHVERFRTEEDLTESTFKQMLNNAYRYRNECIIENKRIMMEDDIDSGILLNAFYNSRRYEEIINFPNKDIGAYHLFRAFTAYETGENAIVVKELEQYMELSLDRAYIKEISDMSNNRFKAFYILIKYLAESGEQENGDYYLQKMKDYYNLLYPQTDNIISDRLQGQHYTCLHWAEGMLNHFQTQTGSLTEKKILVYGAGVISKRILLKNPILKNMIVAFIDQYSGRKLLEGIQVVRLEEIGQFQGVSEIVVAVPHQFEKIKQDIVKVCTDIPVISVNELF